MNSLKNFFKMYKVEQKIFFRSADVIIFNLAMPLAVFILIAVTGGSKNAGELSYAGSSLTFIQSAYAALTTVGICCSAFMSIPITIVESRSKGVLRRIYCSPCSPFRLLASDVIASGVMAAISSLIVTVAAVLFFGYTMKGNIFIYIITWFLTMAAMFSIGLLTASLCRTAKSLNIATSLLYFPMLLFSGATVPAEVFPKGLRFFSDILPLGIGINLLKSVSMGVYDGTAIPAVFLCAVTVVCTVIAVKTFRWE